MDEWQITTSTTQRTGLREHVLNVMDKPRTAGDNYRIGGFQVDPVLGRHVVKGEQCVRLVGDLGDGLRPLGLELVGKGLDGSLGVGLVLGVAYLGQCPAGGRLDRLRQGIQYVGRDVEPAALLGCLGKDVAHRRPEPEGAVADSEHRGPHPPTLAVSQQARPGLCRLAVTAGDGHELFSSVGPHADHDQAAQAVLA